MDQLPVEIIREIFKYYVWETPNFDTWWKKNGKCLETL